MEFYLVPDHHSQPHRLRAPRSAFGGAPSCGLDNLLCNLVQDPSTHRPARIPKPRHSSSFHPLVDLTLYQDHDRDDEDEGQAIAFALTHHHQHRERERERERARQLQLEQYQLDRQRARRLREFQEARAAAAAMAREQQRQRQRQLHILHLQQEAREQQERQHRLSLENAQKRQEHKRQIDLQRRHRQQQQDLNAQIQHDFWEALQRQFFPSVQDREQERQAGIEAHLKQRARGEKEQIERTRALGKEKRSDAQETFEGALQLGDAFLRAFFGAEPDEEKEEKKDEILEKATADESTSETRSETEHATQSHQELAVPRADGEREVEVSVEDTSSTDSAGQSSVTAKDIEMTDAPSAGKKEALNASSDANETVLFHYPHVAPTSYDAKNLKLALQGDQLRIEGLWKSSSTLEALSTKHSPAQRQAQVKQKEGQEEEEEKKSSTGSSRSNSPHRGRSPRRARVSDVDENDMEIIEPEPELQDEAEGKASLESAGRNAEEKEEEEEGYISIDVDARADARAKTSNAKPSTLSPLLLSIPHNADASSIRADLHDQGLTIYISSLMNDA
ncbi:hypothetical protein IE81DRAFT_326312 [Ceraceosorus guamensis]|uniref:SHSP domain-containing protein n=1 Tax=Ceraceosorus guamensis TaxID=1522189 RepID=A0A316VPT6_9BASI|nr:hypothetical protein IE81DRAFT_326312 [Ceraceosorus guamensis]PWN39659.1 hypothetical protein IE81DRAFT_326312 [Ceraceosorus guamensis]